MGCHGRPCRSSRSAVSGKVAHLRDRRFGAMSTIEPPRPLGLARCRLGAFRSEIARTREGRAGRVRILHEPTPSPPRPGAHCTRAALGAGCRCGVSARATSQAPTSTLAHEGPDVGRGARPARPSGLTHRIRLSDVPRRGRAAEDVGPYHRFRPTDRSPLRPTDRSAVRPTDHRPVRCVIRPCSCRGFGDERDFASERSEVKSRGPSSLGTTRGVPGAGCPTRPPRRS